MVSVEGKRSGNVDENVVTNLVISASVGEEPVDHVLEDIPVHTSLIITFTFM